MMKTVFPKQQECKTTTLLCRITNKTIQIKRVVLGPGKDIVSDREQMLENRTEIRLRIGVESRVEEDVKTFLSVTN